MPSLSFLISNSIIVGRIDSSIAAVTSIILSYADKICCVLSLYEHVFIYSHKSFDGINHSPRIL